jgi:hypothetical protein
MRRLLLVVIMLVPTILLAAVAERDTLRTQGHEYRQWVYDQNKVGDQNSNLDQNIGFISNDRIRTHTERVYFYDQIELAIQISKETGYPLAFYLFDHTCRTCLYDLPELYTNPEVVEKSQKFINVYVELPRLEVYLSSYGMMNSGRTVQFFLPSMRRLRVLDSATVENLLETYDLMLNYVNSLTKEERLDKELELKKTRSAYR